MAETFIVDKNLAGEDIYKQILPQIKSLLSKDDNRISNLSNFSAALKQSFEKISWVGFYLYDGEKLYLGPFQGKVACTFIKVGSGVCGTAAAERRTVIVPDVNQFPGHIFCDADSKSEIVVPVMKGEELFGVLDLDSSEYNSFNSTDKEYLEELCRFISDEIL